MNITTVFFDVGGTLIHPDMSRLIAPLLARVHPTAEQYAIAERAAKCVPMGDGEHPAAPHEAGDLGSHAGPINKGHWRVFFEALVDALGCGHDLLGELTRRAGNSEHWTLVDPEAASVLAQLRRNYRLAVISNADGRIDECLRRSGLDKFFDKLIDSGRVGYEKPDPRIFCAALEEMGAGPRESLYVGDLYAIDYRGASRAGMAAVLVDPNGVYRGWKVDRIARLGQLPQWIREQQQSSVTRV